MVASTIACGGSNPPPKVAPNAASEEDELDDVEQEGVPPEKRSGDEAKAKSPSADEAAKTKGEPSFGEDLSVDQAIAVAADTERMNVDPDTLGQPLRDEKVYEPCKLKQSDHFSLRVAIWNGHAVGIDVTTTPENKTLATCVKSQMKGLSWKPRVKSLNTVEYQM